MHIRSSSTVLRRYFYPMAIYCDFASYNQTNGSDAEASAWLLEALVGEDDNIDTYSVIKARQ